VASDDAADSEDDPATALSTISSFEGGTSAAGAAFGTAAAGVTTSEGTGASSAAGLKAGAAGLTGFLMAAEARGTRGFVLGTGGGLLRIV